MIIWPDDQNHRCTAVCRIAWGAEFISGLHYILPLRSLVYFSTQLFCRLSDSISLLLPLILCFPVSTSYCEPFFNQKCAKNMGHLLALDAIEDESNPSMNYQKHGIFFLLKFCYMNDSIFCAHFCFNITPSICSFHLEIVLIVYARKPPKATDF